MIGGDRDLSCCLACLPVSLPCSGQVERRWRCPGWRESPGVGWRPHGAEGAAESACGGNSRRYL